MTQSITLHVYDLSHGMANGFSGAILGTTIEGIWHTGVVVHGQEYFFGGGIQRTSPAQFLLRHNLKGVTRIHDLGTTTKTKDEIDRFLGSITHKYTTTTYDLFKNNCNNFSNEMVKFLKDDETGIPQYIMDLPNTVLATPIGRTLIGPIFEQMQKRMYQTGQQSGLIDFNDDQSSGNGRRGLSELSNKPYIALQRRLRHDYGQNMVNFFEKMDRKGIKSVVRVPKTNYSVSSLRYDIDEVIKTTEVAILLYRSSEIGLISLIKSKLAKAEQEIDIYEIDIDTTDSFEEIYEICDAFLDITEERECLLMDSVGNDISYAVLMTYELVNSSDLGLEFKNVVDKYKEVVPQLYLSYESCMGIYTVAECEEKVGMMIRELHIESESNAISQLLEPSIDQVLNLGLATVDREKVRRVLKTTNGNVDAAMNLLLQ